MRGGKKFLLLGCGNETLRSLAVGEKERLRCWSDSRTKMGEDDGDGFWNRFAYWTVRDNSPISEDSDNAECLL